jgi:hypothetical protein
VATVELPAGRVVECAVLLVRGKATFLGRRRMGPAQQGQRRQVNIAT